MPSLIMDVVAVGGVSIDIVRRPSMGRILATLRIQPGRCASQAILDRAPACSATQVDSD